MRLNRGTIIFVVVLALVIAVALFLLNEDDTAPEDTAEPTSVAQNFFEDMTADTVTEVSITRRVGESDATVTVDSALTPETITYVLVDDTWEIEGADEAADATPEPEATPDAEVTAEAEATADAEMEATAEVTEEASSGTPPIDQTAVSQAVSTLLGLRYRDSFEDDNLEQFGLADPAYEITFVAGGENYRLRIGNQNVSGTQYYALLGESDTVYLITSVADTNVVLDLLNDTPYDLPPTPTPVPVLNAPGPLFTGYTAEAVNTFVLRDEESGEELTLIKDASSDLWRIEGSDATVEQQLVNIYLSQIGSMTVIDKLPGDNLEALGLDDPSRFMIASVDETTNYILALGDADPTGTRYYARINDFQEVGVIEAGMVDFIFSMLESPPIVPEVTPEVTADAESTAEATEAIEATEDITEEVTPEMTEEVTPEATEEPED